MASLGWGRKVSAFGCSMRFVLSKFMFIMMAAVFWAAEVECRRKRKNKRTGGSVDRSFWRTIKWTYLAVFVPVFLFFIYSVWKDPDSGKIARTTWKQIQKRSMGFLKNKKKRRKSKKSQ